MSAGERGGIGCGWLGGSEFVGDKDKQGVGSEGTKLLAAVREGCCVW